MTLRAHIALALLVALSILGIVLLVRRRHLKAKYALLWLSLGVVMVVFAAVPGLLDWTAERLGVWYPPTLLILLGLVLLLMIVVHFSYELTRSENRTRALAEQMALLRLELTRLQRRLDDDAGPSDPAGGSGGSGASPQPSAGSAAGDTD